MKNRGDSAVNSGASAYETWMLLCVVSLLTFVINKEVNIRPVLTSCS